MLPGDVLDVNFSCLPVDLAVRRKTPRGKDMSRAVALLEAPPDLGRETPDLRALGPGSLSVPGYCWRRWRQLTAPDSQQGSLLSEKRNCFGLPLIPNSQLVNI